MKSESRAGAARLCAIWVAVVALVCVVGWLYWRLMDPGMAGFIQDDGAYLVTSKALAEGKGYRLLHMIGEPAQVKHPIGYPLVLAAGWRINPAFPDNLALLNAMTLAFGMAALLVIFGYLAFLKGLPALLAVAVVLLVAATMPAMRFLTSIMSEGPYLFWSFVTLSATEMYRRHRSAGWLLAVILGSAISFHTRLFGIALLAGLTIWFLLQRHWRHAATYVGGVLTLAVVPWFVWVQAQRRSLTADNFMQTFPYANYYEEITNYLRDGTYVGRLQATVSHAVGRLLEVMFSLVPHLRILRPDWLARPTIAGVYETLVTVAGYCLVGYFAALLVRGIRSVARERAWSAVAPDPWYTICYVGLMLVWSYVAHQPRFLLMVLPLLWLYFLRPFVPLVRRALARSWLGGAAGTARRPRARSLARGVPRRVAHANVPFHRHGEPEIPGPVERLSGQFRLHPSASPGRCRDGEQQSGCLLSVYREEGILSLLGRIRGIAPALL